MDIQANTDYQIVKALSLADISTAIENRRFLGDVSDMDLELVEQILPHCSKTQLIHIEKSTKNRDLSPVTDKLWKSFYEREFGTESTESVSQIMKEWNLKFKWSELYQEKSKRVKGAKKKEDDGKLSGQVRVCKKVSPFSGKKEKWLKKKFVGAKHSSYGKRRKLTSFEYARFEGCIS